MFSVSATDNNYNVIFFLFMFIFLFCQNQFEPFIINTINTMEFILLSCFIFVIFLESILFINYTFQQILLSFLILSPFILVIYFIFDYKRKKLEMDNDNDYVSKTDCVEMGCDSKGHQIII